MARIRVLAPHRTIGHRGPVSAATPSSNRPLTAFGPDFPFDFEAWVRGGIGSIPIERHGSEVAVVGAGISGLVAALELMRIGLRPVVYEAGRIGGRLRSEPFSAAPDVLAELGGMRFPISGTAFYHYVDRCGLETAAFPNPLTEAAGNRRHRCPSQQREVVLILPWTAPSSLARRSLQRVWQKA